MGTFVGLLAIAYIVSFGGFCSWLADEKGRDYVIWFFLGAVFGIVALLALIGAPEITVEDKAKAASAYKTRIAAEEEYLAKVGNALQKSAVEAKAKEESEGAEKAREEKEREVKRLAKLRENPPEFPSFGKK